jgi:hypothetical protein
MSAIRTQQFRWNKGAAETGRKTLARLWRSPFPIATKIIGSFHMLNSLVFPTLLLLSLSMVALPFAFGDQTQFAYVLINALLLVTTISILFTYWIAHRYGNFKSSARGTTTILTRALLFMLITSGLTIHNGLAVVQGLFGRATPFMRTPKLNLAPDHKSGSKRAYPGQFSSPVLAAEISLGILFSLLAIYCLFKGHYIIVPAFTYFACGYLMIVYFTIAEMLANTKTSG